MKTFRLNLFILFAALPVLISASLQVQKPGEPAEHPERGILSSRCDYEGDGAGKCDEFCLQSGWNIGDCSPDDICFCY